MLVEGLLHESLTFRIARVGAVNLAQTALADETGVHEEFLALFVGVEWIRVCEGDFFAFRDVRNSEDGHHVAVEVVGCII